MGFLVNSEMSHTGGAKNSMFIVYAAGLPVMAAPWAAPLIVAPLLKRQARRMRLLGRWPVGANNDDKN